MKIDISVVISAHREGRLAHPTLRSVFRSAAFANESGVRSEVIVVLDRADSETRAYFETCGHPCLKLYQVDLGDPGMARNHGVEKASGKYVAFSDADDLFGKGWLGAAFQYAESRGEFCVYYPEYVICFERENLIVRCKDTDDETLNISTMIEFNCWNSVHFLAPKTLLAENPFRPTPLDSGFGYEDWHWYCELIADGIPIRIVPESCVFYRKKLNGSRLSAHNQHQVVIQPSKLFDPEIFSSLIREKNYRNVK